MVRSTPTTSTIAGEQGIEPGIRLGLTRRLGNRKISSACAHKAHSDFGMPFRGGREKRSSAGVVPGFLCVVALVAAFLGARGNGMFSSALLQKRLQ